MSLGRPFTSEAVQLVFASCRVGARQPSSWVCRQCKSRGGAQRTLTKWSTSGTSTAILRSHSRKLESPQFRRPISQNAKSKDAEKSDNGTQAELPSHEEQRRSKISKRFFKLMDNLQSNIFFAGQRLNDLTGYSGIEKLKKEIEEQEQAVKSAQDQLAGAKGNYTSAIQQRSDSQREVNELLQRKNSWSPQDLERFTSLYRNDHANEQAETEAQQKLADAERASEEANAKLGGQILRRYHEEQIWSDKIRRMSTWGTWGLMGVNVLLFLVFQIGVEPWRRKRLVKGFEEKVIEALETQKDHANKVTGEALAALQATHNASTADLVAAPTEVEEATKTIVAESVASEVSVDADSLQDPLPPQEPMQSTPSIETWLLGLQDLKSRLRNAFSKEETIVRQVDLTKKLLEGAFVGVMLTSIVAALIRGR